MIPVEEALAKVLELVDPLPEERLPLRRALGRTLTRPVAARLTQPPFDAAQMDGYWLNAADLRPGATLTVVGEAAAGRAFAGAPAPGQAIRVSTGAPCPAAPGRVVMQEETARAGDRLTLAATLSGADYIRRRGQDFAEGDAYYPRAPLTARDIGLIAAMNAAEVWVRRRPVVAILSTGDELVEPGETPGPDQIISANGVMLAALIEQAGAEARLLPIARDTADSLRFAFGLAEGADLIVTSGGASVGDHDIVAEVAEGLGLARSFWKIAMRPGKPLMAGRMGAAALLGLPGNPVSSFVCAKLFLLPMIARMMGAGATIAPRKAVLAEDVGPTGPRAHYMRARLTPGDPLPRIAADKAQDSALLGVLARADALLIRPAGDGPRKAGETVDYLPL